MLQIALVTKTYPEAKRWIEYKFKDKIKEVNRMLGKYTLNNGDEVHICYDNDPIRYKGMNFDVCCVSTSAFGSEAERVILERTSR